jgi:flagellum-specific peptidoglycan hydrolase FlgJ
MSDGTVLGVKVGVIVKEYIFMKISLLLIAAYFYAASSDLSEDKTLSYIDLYSDYAIAEMHRTGIPASIKLAQAIHESASGTSPFAINSKNHFGIKCKSYWKGGKYYHKDDDHNKQGQLVESCFRAYDQVMDSYIDHSNFLKDSPYYSNLFRMKNQGYESWARALQHYGYATDPLYGEKLIRIIKRHQLFLMDDKS